MIFTHASDNEQQKAAQADLFQLVLDVSDYQVDCDVVLAACGNEKPDNKSESPPSLTSGSVLSWGCIIQRTALAISPGLSPLGTTISAKIMVGEM